MCERYPGYLFGGTPVSSWDRSYNSLENQYHTGPPQYRNRLASTRCWGSMSDGGGISAAGGDICRTNLIVNYLPQSVTDKELYTLFQTQGPVESCRVMKDFKTGYSYGFGFVNFLREEDAVRAIDNLNGYRLRNKRLKVSYARPSSEEIKDTNLYVTNLPRSITEDQLETIFGKYGRIVQKHILRDKSSGAPRGVAFVRYDKREEAQEAIAALNNVIPEGGTEPLCVKVAEEHGKQKAAYYAGYAAAFHQNRGNFNNSIGWSDGAGEAVDSCPPHGDFEWGCDNCGPPTDIWDRYPAQISPPNFPRNGCRSGACVNRINYMKGPPRGQRGRNPPWAPEDRFKIQKFRNGPSPYW